MTIADVLTPNGLLSIFAFLIGFLFLLGVIAGIFFLLGYAFLLWYKWKDREKTVLDSVLLQIALPRENEIKIDAAEQLFSIFASLTKGGRFAFLKPQQNFSFE